MTTPTKCHWMCTVCLISLAQPGGAGCGDDAGTPDIDGGVDARILPDVDMVEPDPGFDDDHVPYVPTNKFSNLGYRAQMDNARR